MKFNDQPTDPLDELLKTARWPEPDCAQLDRLTQHWQQIAKQYRRRLLLTTLAAAALVPTVAFVGMIAIAGQRPTNAVVERSPAISPFDLGKSPVEVSTSQEAASAGNLKEPQPVPMVREPDAFERALAEAHRHNFGLPQPAAVAEVPQSAAKAPDREVESLFAAMYSSRIDTRLAAASVLGSRNDPTISARLVQMTLEGIVRREALVALLHSTDPVAKKFLSYASRDLTLSPSVRAIHSSIFKSHSIDEIQ